MNSLSVILVSAAIAATATPAISAVTAYTSQAAFDAAVTSKTMFGFDEGNSSLHYHVVSNPYTQSGITFANNLTAANMLSGGTPIIFLIGNATTPAYGKDFLSFQNTDVGVSADLTMSGITAFGFEYATYIADGPATVAVNGGTPFAISVTGTPSFIGFTSTAPITDISIFFPTAYSFDLTSVSYATASDPNMPSPAPEPASWAMIIGGFGMVGSAMRRRKASFA